MLGVFVKDNIVWPGQNHQKVRGVKKKQRAQGEKFDIRKFHTIVLDQGL